MSAEMQACDHDRRAPAVCVFCASRVGEGPQWLAAARDAGRAIAARGWTLVYGGGRVGLMGALADGALSIGGRVVGVIPRSLMDLEVGHGGLAELEIVGDMATRKTRMIAISDAFVALPGGLGTLDELFEVLTLRQLREHAKPVGLLDQDGYWQPLLGLCQAMAAAGFVPPGDLAALRVAAGIDAVLDQLFEAPSKPS